MNKQDVIDKLTETVQDKLRCEEYNDLDEIEIRAILNAAYSSGYQEGFDDNQELLRLGL